MLRAQQTGLDVAWIPGVMVVMALTYSLSAWSVGVLSDRLDRRILLVIGMALLMAADLILGVGWSVQAVFAGVAVWGLHVGFTQGTLAAMVSEILPATLRGIALGVFNLIGGIRMFDALLRNRCVQASTVTKSQPNLTSEMWDLQ